MSQVYGYARVSTKEQNTNRQYMTLLEEGVSAQNIYIDKETGRKFNRKAYMELLNRIQSNDLLIITSIDRLGRDYKAILEQWRYITQEIHAHVRVLDMPILDTTKTTEGLLGVFICDMVLQVLSYLADSTWQNIKTNQRQGIERAKQEGKHLGRPKKELPQQFNEIFIKWKCGHITTNEAILSLGLSKSTFYRIAKDVPEQEGGKNVL